MFTLFLWIETPSAPSKPKAEIIDKNTIKITWNAPSTDDGTLVTGYSIERMVDQSGRWDKVEDKVGFDVDCICIAMSLGLLKTVIVWMILKWSLK